MKGQKKKEEKEKVGMNYVVETSKNENGTVIAEGIKCFFFHFFEKNLIFLVLEGKKNCIRRLRKVKIVERQWKPLLTLPFYQSFPQNKNK